MGLSGLFGRATANSKAVALGRLALFDGLGRGELEGLSRMTEDIDLPAGKVLLREGATAYQFFLIVEGEAEVTKVGERVRRLGPGDFFGETGLIERTPLGTTVCAVSPLRCLVMSSHAFRGLIESEAQVERRILRRLVAQNVHEREIAEAALRRQVELTAHQALHDSLTGLANRRLFRDRIEHAVQLANRNGGSFTVVLMDLDRFKEVNDTLGHHAGDALLGEIGTRLADVLRGADTVARLGGDEFGVVLEGSGPGAIVPVVEKIRAAVEEPVQIQGLPIGVEASIGAASYPEHGTDVDSLIQHADVAMYVAKEENTAYAVYDPGANPHDPARLTLIGELRRAIDEQELVLHYQPKAVLQNASVASVEALLRWAHPSRGLLMPDAFIPLAQQTGLIKPLTLHVIDAAIKQCLTWERSGLVLSVAVNLSTRNLLDTEFPDEVGRLIGDSGFDPARLELEITETTMLADPVRTKCVLERLSAMGIRLSIDDFGVGYSSLSYLKSLPVSEIKIDRSFVMKMLHDEDDAVIVRSTIDLGRNLGLDVVAEGVESEAVWCELGALGCNLAQGFFLSRPLPADELAAWIHRPRGVIELTNRAVA
jgi:diguanylate cyclase (GGDEF)-like protein